MTPSVKITVSERNGRDCASTGSAWETAIGYSRAMRAGDFISVTGTVGIEADGRFAPTIKAQTRRALEIIVAAIESLGGQTSIEFHGRVLILRRETWRRVIEGECSPPRTRYLLLIRVTLSWIGLEIDHWLDSNVPSAQAYEPALRMGTVHPKNSRSDVGNSSDSAKCPS